MSPRRTRLLLLGSLVLNLLLLALVGAWVAHRGGPRFIVEQLGLARKTHRPGPSALEMRKRFESYPDTPGEIVFAGDSLIARMPWAEHFGTVKNRGIAGETADGLLQRLEEITRANPATVYLGVGVNDLMRGVSVEQTHEDMLRIVERIATDSPETQVLVQSILPVNAAKLTSADGKKLNAAIRGLNERLASAADAAGYRFIDLTEAMAGSDGQLRADFTDDGVHLNAAGQDAHAAAMRRTIDGTAALGGVFTRPED